MNSSLSLFLLLCALQIPGDSGTASNDLVADKPKATEVLILLQEITGRPGSSQEEVQIQQVYIASDRILVEDRSRGLIRILRLDVHEPVLW